MVVMRRPSTALQLNGDIPFKVSCWLAPRLALPVRPRAKRWLGLLATASATGQPAATHHSTGQEKMGQGKMGQEKMGQGKMGQGKMGQAKMGQAKMGQGKLHGLSTVGSIPGRWTRQAETVGSPHGAQRCYVDHLNSCLAE